MYVNNILTHSEVIQHVNCGQKFLNKTQPILDRLEGHYCFNFDLSIGGYWYSNIVQIPTVILKRCDKQTEEVYNITCATDEEISEKHPNTFYINYYVQNQLIYPQNYSFPYKKVQTYHWEQYNMNKKEVYTGEIFFNLANVQTDAGFIFQDVNDTLNFIELENKRITYGQIDYLQDHILSLEVFLSKKLSIYSRTYLRFQDVIANVRAFMDLIMILIRLFFDIYLENEYSVFLYQKLFKLEYVIDKEDDFKSPKNMKRIPFKSESKKDLNELE